MRHRTLNLAAILILVFPLYAHAITAYDDAADAMYNGGIYHGLNGGFGFSAWTSNAFPFGGNPALQAFVSSSSVNGTPGPDIDTGGRAWGNFVQPGGNTFFARRNLLSDLTVGGTYSVDFDTGSNDGQETISFGQGNNAICQFYLLSSQPNYQFYDALSAITYDTGIQQTFGGLTLTLTRDTASTYSFQAVRLTDSLTYNFPSSPYNTSLITGIRTMTVTNLDGGNGLGHSMYVNRLAATELPEPGGLAVMLAMGTVMLMRRPRGCAQARA